VKNSKLDTVEEQLQATHQQIQQIFAEAELLNATCSRGTNTILLLSNAKSQPGTGDMRKLEEANEAANSSVNAPQSTQTSDSRPLTDVLIPLLLNLLEHTISVK